MWWLRGVRRGRCWRFKWLRSDAESGWLPNGYASMECFKLMRPPGFSTGALAFADFRRGLALVRDHRLPAIELSALRVAELAPLLGALDELELDSFRYI